MLFTFNNICVVLVAGSEMRGLPELVHSAIWQTDINVRTHLCCNIILTGGTTMLPGKCCI